VDLSRDVARLMHDRNRAGAGVFEDFALDDVDNRRPIAVAVPGDDAARLNHELAQTQLAFLEFCRLIGEIDGGEDRIADALGGVLSILVRSVPRLSAGHSPALAGPNVVNAAPATMPAASRLWRIARPVVR
jgi:hypothetical protein